MSLSDALGHRVSGATPAAIDHYEQAARELLCLIDDPVASVERSIAASPDMTMAHVLVAYLNLLGTEPAGLPAAREAPCRRRTLPGHRARGPARGGGRRPGPRPLARCRPPRLEDLSIRHPRDLLALQVGHQIDFFTGALAHAARPHRARAESHWHDGMPGHHAVLGMHAFGLEETADYAHAETQGRRSVELEPRDSWGWHAVAHVLEMRHAAARRHRLAAADPPAWATGSFFAVPQLVAPGAVPPGAGPITTRCWRCMTGLSAAPARRGAGHDRRLGAAVAAEAARRGRRRALADAGRTLGAAGRCRQLRVQRPARDDRLRRRRPQAEPRGCSKRSAQAVSDGGDNASFTREVGHPATRRWPPSATATMAGGGRCCAASADQRAPLRRQPCAARPDRPDADRSGVAHWATRAGARTGGRAPAQRPHSPLAQRNWRRALTLPRAG